MKDSLSFPLVLATVFVGALLAIFDPANRQAGPAVAQTQAQAAPTMPAAPAQPSSATVAQL